MFRAVSGRCAVVLSSLRLPIPDEKALATLTTLGFSVIEVDLVQLARSRVGVSRYRRGAGAADAPETFDCSSFIKWLYAERGVWLPRRTIQQIALGTAIDTCDILAGDVVFTTGRINYYHDDPTQGVGHVGIATGEGTIVHAANSRKGIIESSLQDFLKEETPRGVRRYVSQAAATITLETPLSREVECSDDLRWIILQQLPRP